MKGLREFNDKFAADDQRPLSVVVRNDDGDIVGGLIGKTFWNYLFVEFLWVDSNQQTGGIGSQILLKAEGEASSRGCEFSLLDTFSFQALPFYERLDYQVFGSIGGFAGNHERHYLRKRL